MKNNKISAFTLVELIVVITILAVLATVAFISFQGYTSSSRDSVRLADLKNVEKQLNIHFTQNNIYPDPSSPVSIPTGGTQGELGKSVTNQIGVSEVKDPLTKNYYFYRISQNKRKYQLMGFLENSDSITFSPLRSTFAENDIPYSKGDKLGIVLNSDGKTLPTTIDLSTGTYNVIFSNKTEENLINVSGEDNFVELKAADKGVFDESLVGYWDMETMTSDGKLADLSGNNNHGTIHDANNSGLATPVNGSMVFDGVDDYVEMADNQVLDGFEEFTIIIKHDFNTTEYRQLIISKMVHSSGIMSDDAYSFMLEPNFETIIEATNPQGDYRYPRFSAINKKGISSIIYENNYINFYFDGNFQKLITSSNELVDGINSSGNSLYLGARYRVSGDIDQFMNGTLDEIMIFNRALSQSEINDIYTQIQ